MSLYLISQYLSRSLQVPTWDCFLVNGYTIAGHRLACKSYLWLQAIKIPLHGQVLD